MTHNEAQREMSIERYLLGELQGDARDEFEDHLFDCEICSADLQTGMTFTDGIKAGGPELVPTLVSQPASQPAWNASAARPKTVPAWTRVSGWAASLLQPSIAAPAFAACLAVICVQSFVVQPRLHRQIAEAEMPAVVDVVSLQGTTRSLDTPAEIHAHPGDRFVLSVEIPSAHGFRAFRYTLVSPAGKPVWHIDLPSTQANDTVTLSVAVGSTSYGTNVLKIEGIPQAEGAQPVSLDQRPFRLIDK